MTVEQANLLSYEQAIESINREVRSLPAIRLPLTELLDCFLAEPIVAPFDLPRFDNSAMDGYGVIASDVAAASKDDPANLIVKATIEAGDNSDIKLESGDAVRIFTGARVPKSVEAVVMREHCGEPVAGESRLRVERSAAYGENIRRRGEEIREGDQVVERGTRVTPPILGLIASLGFSDFTVVRKPKIAIVSTGNELVNPGEKLEDGQIYNSNSFALAAAVRSLGLPEPLAFHAMDTKESTESTFAEALAKADLVISAGGVSVGDRDFVKGVLEKKHSVSTHFWRVAVKPGKPVYFGTANSEGERKTIFGLPGNPVSALVTFHLFVKTALLRMQGSAEHNRQVWSANASDRMSKKPGRLDFVRAMLDCGDDATLHTTPTHGQDSHMLSGLARADCLIHFEAEETEIKKGSRTTVERLLWSEY